MRIPVGKLRIANAKREHGVRQSLAVIAARPHSHDDRAIAAARQVPGRGIGGGVAAHSGGRNCWGRERQQRLRADLLEVHLAQVDFCRRGQSNPGESERFSALLKGSKLKEKDERQHPPPAVGSSLIARTFAITIHGPREGDRHIFPGTTLDNLPTERCASREFAGKMTSPRPVNLYR